MDFHQTVQAWVVANGLGPADQKVLVATGLIALGVVVLAFLANFVAKRLVLRAVETVVRKTSTSWDDAILERHVFDRLSHLAPGMVLYLLAGFILPEREGVASLLHSAAIVYMTVITAGVADSFINAINDIYESSAAARVRPIKSYVQVVKIILYALTSILVISTLIGRSPLVLLSGIGALSAVLLLVFKDSILGLVASIQLSSNDMVRKGDWIEVPKYGADGDVIDIALTTIRVQNFDKTISTVPSYALISDSFRNWRGMSESGGRRIKRAVYLNTDSVEFLSEQAIESYGRMELIADYIEGKKQELVTANEGQAGDPSVPVNGRRLTNLGTFRAYVLAYLQQHPAIHRGMTLLVRQLAPSDRGVGIELYCFTNDTGWVTYEDVQADIFDHLLAVAPEFGLRVFQQPSGHDFRAGLGNKAS